MSNPSEPVRIEVESVADAIDESEADRPDTIVVEPADEACKPSPDEIDRLGASSSGIQSS